MGSDFDAMVHDPLEKSGVVLEMRFSMPDDLDVLGEDRKPCVVVLDDWMNRILEDPGYVDVFTKTGAPSPPHVVRDSASVVPAAVAGGGVAVERKQLLSVQILDGTRIGATISCTVPNSRKPGTIIKSGQRNPAVTFSSTSTR